MEEIHYIMISKKTKQSFYNKSGTDNLHDIQYWINIIAWCHGYWCNGLKVLSSQYDYITVLKVYAGTTDELKYFASTEVKSNWSSKSFNASK